MRRLGRAERPHQVEQAGGAGLDQRQVGGALLPLPLLRQRPTPDEAAGVGPGEAALGVEREGGAHQGQQVGLGGDGAGVGGQPLGQHAVDFILHGGTRARNGAGGNGVT
jgi:hypothetical protein